MITNAPNFQFRQTDKHLKILTTTHTFLIANHLRKKCKKNFYRSQEEALAIRDVKVLFVDCFSSSSLLSPLASPSFHLSAFTFVVCIGKSEMQKNALRSSSGCPIPVEFQFSFYFDLMLFLETLIVGELERC